MEDTLELQLTTTLYMTSELILSTNLTNLTHCTNTNSSCTFSSIKLSPYYQHSLAIAASFTLAYLFIFMPCMVGNCLVCLIVVKNRHMRTVTNLFILNLAISDLLVGIFCIPTTLVDNLITGTVISYRIMASLLYIKLPHTTETSTPTGQEASLSQGPTSNPSH